MPSIPKFDLSTNTAFRRSMPPIVRAELKRFYGPAYTSIDIAHVTRDQIGIRAYPNLAHLDFSAAAGHIQTIGPTTINESMRSEARQVKVAGEELVEHSAGGDATRLGMGSKFLLTPQALARAIEIHNLTNPTAQFQLDRSALARTSPLSLGARHMFQTTFDLIAAAARVGRPIEDALKSQRALITLNPKTAIEIIREFVKYDFFGLPSENVFFMIDNVFPGMSLDQGKVGYEQRATMNLYNHGQMVMQEAVDQQIFTVSFIKTTGDIRMRYLSSDEFGQVLKAMANKVSYPIEDNDYLTRSFDPNGLAVALQLGRAGNRMIVEVSKQKEDNPQKGGFVAFDRLLERCVLIESDSGGTVVDNSNRASLARIRYLNRNFNMFPSPFEVWDQLRQKGLPYPHLTVKEGSLYLQIPQGDQNFLVRTAFIQNENARPINNLKEIQDAPRTLRAMFDQDSQKDFLDQARRFGLIS